MPKNETNKVGQGTQKQHGTQHSFSFNVAPVCTAMLCREGLWRNVDATEVAVDCHGIGLQIVPVDKLIPFRHRYQLTDLKEIMVFDLLCRVRK